MTPDKKAVRRWSAEEPERTVPEGVLVGHVYDLEIAQRLGTIFTTWPGIANVQKLNHTEPI